MNNNETFVKLLLIGDSGVGKSCILMRFVEDRFTDAFYNTIGVDFKTKHLTLNNRKCKLQIWDTAGQQRFRTITANYYKGANGIMLVFDVTNQESFTHLDYWLQEIQKNGTLNVQKILIGNKIDIANKRVISQQKAQEYAKKNGLTYVEVSACDARNIDLVFQTIVKNILIIRDSQKKSSEQKQRIPAQDLRVNQPNPNRQQSNSCC